MRTSKELAIELKALDERLEVVENPNRVGLSNVKLLGKDICPVPTGIIKDEPDPSYYYTFPNGWSARHKSYNETMDMVKDTLEKIKTPEGSDLFFGMGEYA